MNGMPCNENRHCYYQEYHGNSKYCRVLDGEPYEDGKCAFYKYKENDFSGGKTNAGSSEENAGEAERG